jgi:UDP-2,3-diacylglucosamine hydrolase
VSVLFVSDLHLDAARPEGIREFVDFVGTQACTAERVYILGDLFEAWIGDDDDEPGLVPVVEALAGLTGAGVACHLMHGNRDFLLGSRFAAASGCRLLGDYETIDVYDERVLLTHGDLLCTDDVAYMNLRATVRDPAWQRSFLAKPLAERRRLAAELRARSKSEVAAKPEDIMDVNAATVAETMRRHGVCVLLHGHTHRPAIHEFSLDGTPAKRIVLGAWDHGPSIGRWTRLGFELSS